MIRRDVLMSVIGLTGSLVLTGSAAAAAGRSKFRAIAFDAFPIFDPRPIAARCEALFPGRGSELIQTWRTRQFEYTWLRTAAGRYADFERVTAESLTFAAEALKLDLTAEKRDQLLQAHFELKTWPNVIPVLTRLRDAGLPLVFLSNFTPGMLNSCIKSAGLEGMFDAVLSTDSAQTYKPDPRAYALGEAALNLPRERILFVAFAGWDAAGAKLFGYPTFWANRLGLPPERFGPMPDATSSDLSALPAYIG
jgi:2-haloacid dehalogenase